jgi:hypothetical protein
MLLLLVYAILLLGGQVTMLCNFHVISATSSSSMRVLLLLRSMANEDVRKRQECVSQSSAWDDILIANILACLCLCVCRPLLSLPSHALSLSLCVCIDCSACVSYSSAISSQELKKSRGRWGEVDDAIASNKIFIINLLLLLLQTTWNHSKGLLLRLMLTLDQQHEQHLLNLFIPSFLYFSVYELMT